MKLFKNHPKEVGMTYFQHFKFALKLSVRFLLLSITSLLHALFPFICTHTASNQVEKVYEVLCNRECHCCCCTSKLCSCNHSSCCCG